MPSKSEYPSGSNKHIHQSYRIVFEYIKKDTKVHATSFLCQTCYIPAGPNPSSNLWQRTYLKTKKK